jgi:hypothetical protein
MPPATLDAIRNARPKDSEHLWHWVHSYTGVRLSRRRVCRGHQPPFRFFADQWLKRPRMSLWLGSRGSGKSFAQAILTHMESRFHPNLKTRILGGSKAQSLQIYDALSLVLYDSTARLGWDADSVRRLLKTEANYKNGSQVSILAASSTSVRGPHVQSLRLDEVDEIEPSIREAAFGMAMEIGGVPASITMSSTWHNVSGPMTGLVEKAKDGRLPLYTTCVFDVLERCPESRSGPFVGGVDRYANCPRCPIVRWCHSERDRNGDRPLAKISDGHYAIDGLILQAEGISDRAFESDFLCNGPRADGLWFPQFRDNIHVTADAEYRPGYPVHCSIDSGVVTGAVWFQLSEHRGRHRVHVFADYLAEGRGADACAGDVREVGRPYAAGGIKYSTDPAGGSRNPIGPTVIGEYERAGIRPLRRWPHGPVADGLAIIESLLGTADGHVGLFVHPRCTDLIAAFKNYRRAKRGGQWQDFPEDPAHPWEDLMDALRGGLKLEFPNGLGPKPPSRTRPVSHFLN